MTMNKMRFDLVTKDLISMLFDKVVLICRVEGRLELRLKVEAN